MKILDKILDKIKEIWNRLGQPDVEVAEADVDKILKAEGKPELISKKNKKPVVEKVKTNPVRIEDIIPEPAELEKEGR